MTKRTSLWKMFRDIEARRDAIVRARDGGGAHIVSGATTPGKTKRPDRAPYDWTWRSNSSGGVSIPEDQFKESDADLIRDIVSGRRQMSQELEE
jgi:hypothetical protein